MQEVPSLSDPPRVTLIIPTYNRAHLVGNAIESALAQDYPNLDVVIVDDGSTDATAAVLRSYERDPRVSVVLRETNGGVMAAKNTGLNSLPPNTQYFGVLDSDDVLHPDAVSTLMAQFRDRPEPISQVFGWCVDAETGERTGTMTHVAGPISYEDALCGRFDGEFWQLVDRSVLGQLRFDERAGGNEAMVWWPLMKQRPAYLVDHVVRRYDRSGDDRVNRPAFTATGAEKKMWGYRVMLERVGQDMLSACPQRFAFMHLEAAKWAALAGERSIFLSSLKNAWRAYPTSRVLKVGLLSLAPGAVLRSIYARIYSNSQ